MLKDDVIISQQQLYQSTDYKMQDNVNSKQQQLSKYNTVDKARPTLTYIYIKDTADMFLFHRCLVIVDGFVDGNCLSKENKQYMQRMKTIQSNMITQNSQALMNVKVKYEHEIELYTGIL